MQPYKSVRSFYRHQHVAKKVGVFLFVFGIALACGSEEDPPPSCVVAANAGPDQLGKAVGTTISLAGQDASTNCASTEFAWTIESAPSTSSLVEANLQTLAPTFVCDVEGSYVFSLAVSDSMTDDSTSDSVEISCVADIVGQALCGEDLEVLVGQSAGLDGTGSTVAEGDLSYEWTLAQQPSESSLTSSDISSTDLANSSITPDVAGIFKLELRVGDGMRFSDPCITTVTATRAPLTAVPTGANVDACEENVFVLDASQSISPGGLQLSYAWSVTSVPVLSASDNNSFDDASLELARFTTDVEGLYEFALEVSDGTDTSVSVPLQLEALEGQIPPTANAGVDMVLSRDANCGFTKLGVVCGTCSGQFSLSGVGMDADNNPLTTLWSSDDALLLQNPNLLQTTATLDPVSASPGVTTTTTYEVEFSVSDCASTTTDILILSLECTGVMLDL